MVTKYKMVRMKREDFEKIMAKKRDMEFDLQRISGRPLRLKDIRLFKIIADSTWELPDYKNSLMNAANHRHRRQR